MKRKASTQCVFVQKRVHLTVFLNETPSGGQILTPSSDLSSSPFYTVKGGRLIFNTYYKDRFHLGTSKHFFVMLVYIVTDIVTCTSDRVAWIKKINKNREKIGLNINIERMASACCNRHQ